MKKRIILGLTLLIGAIFFLNFKKGAETGIFHGDALGYYMYLPSTFIYHNLDAMNELPKDEGIEEYIFQYLDSRSKEWVTPEGKFIDQYTFGVAIMEMPFFFVGHAMAKLTLEPTTGFSTPYQNAIRLSSIVYGLLGLMIVFKILRRYFDDNTSIVSVAIIALGSNLFWFMFYQAGMAHVPLFFLFALLLWQTILLYEKPQWHKFILIGLLCGFITYIRPADIVCIFIPILFGITDKQTLKERWKFIVNHFSKFVLIAVVCFVIWIPQMMFWKHLSGYFLYDTYGSQQTFNFKYPQIYKGLFGANNG